MSHFLLAAGGLVLWIVYLFAAKDVLAWIAFAALLVVAMLGFTGSRASRSPRSRS
jgi:manganese efflux pump family protein